MEINHKSINNHELGTSLKLACDLTYVRKMNQVARGIHFCELNNS